MSFLDGYNVPDNKSCPAIMAQKDTDRTYKGQSAGYARMDCEISGDRGLIDCQDVNRKLSKCLTEQYIDEHTLDPVELCDIYKNDRNIINITDKHYVQLEDIFVNLNCTRPLLSLRAKEDHAIQVNIL